MSRRRRRSGQSDGFQGYEDGSWHDENRSMPLHNHPAALEEELDFLHQEMRRIMTENEAIVNHNRALQSEVTRKYGEIDKLEQMIPQLQAEKETDIRELIQTGLKLEAELRSREPLKVEVRLLRAEVEHLNTSVGDLTSFASSLRQEVEQVDAEKRQEASMEAEIDVMHKQLIEARRIFELERRANYEEIQNRKQMENYMVSLHRQLQELREEQQDEIGETKEPRLEGGGYQSMDLHHGTENGDRFSDDNNSER